MKNWKIYLVLALYMFVGKVLIAQNQENMQKVEAAKIGFITQRINLTTSQATTFWPLYNDYSMKKKECRSQIRKLREEANGMSASDEKILANIKETFAIKKKEIDIETEYFEKFKKVLSARQLSELYKAEQDFTKMLLSKLEGAEK